MQSYEARLNNFDITFQVDNESQTVGLINKGIVFMKLLVFCETNQITLIMKIKQLFQCRNCKTVSLCLCGTNWPLWGRNLLWNEMTGCRQSHLGFLLMDISFSFLL